MSCNLAENAVFVAFSACLFCPTVSVVLKYAKTHQYLVENSFNFHLLQRARCKYRLKRMHPLYAFSKPNTPVNVVEPLKCITSHYYWRMQGKESL